MWNVMSLQSDKFQFSNVRGFTNKLVKLFVPISKEWIDITNIDFESFSNTDTKDCGIDPSIGITTPYECHSWLDGLNPTIHANNVFWFNVFD